MSFIDHSKMNFQDMRQAYINGVCHHPDKGLIFVHEVSRRADISSSALEEHGIDYEDMSNTNPIAHAADGGLVDLFQCRPYLPEERYLQLDKYCVYLRRDSYRQWRRTMNNSMYKLFPLGRGVLPLKSARSYNLHDPKVIKQLEAVDEYPSLYDAASKIKDATCVSVAFAPNYAVQVEPFTDRISVHYRNLLIGLVSEDLTYIELSDKAAPLVEDLSQYAEVELYNYG